MFSDGIPRSEGRAIDYKPSRRRAVVGNDELKALIDHGASAYALSYMAYFPGSQKGISAKLDKISTQADVATLRLEGGLPSRSTLLDLDDRSEASVPGEQ